MANQPTVTEAVWYHGQCLGEERLKRVVYGKVERP